MRQAATGLQQLGSLDKEMLSNMAKPITVTQPHTQEKPRKQQSKPNRIQKRHNQIVQCDPNIVALTALNSILLNLCDKT